MDPNQLPSPLPQGPGPSQQPSLLYGKSSSNKDTLLFVVIGFLAVGVIIFAIIAISATGTAKKATTTLTQQKTAAAAAARDDQKKIDKQAADIAAESPFRSYVAPLEFGSFEIKFPKNWSGYVEQAKTAGIQVNLIVQPDFIMKENGINQLAAAKIVLEQKSFNDFLKAYDKLKDVTKTDVTVSGIKGTQITGKIPDKRTVRLVAIPVRDKVLVFYNEDSKYSHEFDEILAQSKVLP
jgi:hypothetical protein